MQRMLIPAAIAAAHVAMIGLWVAGRAQFAAPPRDLASLVDEMAGFWAWPWLHALAAALIIAAAWVGKAQPVLWVAGWLTSAAVMGSWGWLTLMWGLDTSPGVSLVGPVLAIATAAITAAVFTERELRGDGRQEAAHRGRSHVTARDRRDPAADSAGDVASRAER